jgi:hypothetical protein
MQLWETGCTAVWQMVPVPKGSKKFLKISCKTVELLTRLFHWMIGTDVGATICGPNKTMLLYVMKMVALFVSASYHQLKWPSAPYNHHI